MNILTETARDLAVCRGVADAVAVVVAASDQWTAKAKVAQQLYSANVDEVHAAIVAVADQTWTPEDARSAAYARTLTLLNEENQ